jgi:hypothetical protein
MATTVRKMHNPDAGWLVEHIDRVGSTRPANG